MSKPALPMSKPGEKPTEERISQVLTRLREVMVEAQSVEIECDIGYTEVENNQTGYLDYEQNGTSTWTIRVNGGAMDDKRRSW